MKRRILVALLATLCGASAAQATESALGRSITGAQITPYVGIVPPTPGLNVSVSYVNYDGNIGASRPVPIGGSTALNLHAKIDLYAATFAYIWDTGKGRWNVASMFTVPYIRPSVSASVFLGQREGAVHDSASNLFDLYFAPVIASYHVSEVEHWSFGLYVYAPTANYEKGRLANPGLNIWTYSPAVGYTHLFDKGSFELSALAGVDFYSKNHATDYKNGAVFRLDVFAMKRTPGGWGFGGVFGAIKQLEDDSGPTADRLNGFSGRSLGIGPALAYKKSFSKESSIDFTLRWVKEFDVKNRIKGEPLVLNMTFAL
ncbi:MAG: transporter [Luteibacter sp.]